jgi:hypothetical protein
LIHNPKWPLTSILIYSLVLVIFFSALGLSGCSYNVKKSSEGFNVFNMKKGIGRFSFEYTNIYKLKGVDLQSRYTDIAFFGPEIGKVRDHTLVNIDVSKLEAGQTCLSVFEHILVLNSNLPDFKILERFPVMVDGKQGEEVVIYYRQPRPTVDVIIPKLEGTEAEPVPTIIRRVMFAHNDAYCKIEIRSLESISESTKVDFGHIIQTFELLD